jgi:hypothetical protein
VQYKNIIQQHTREKSQNLDQFEQVVEGAFEVMKESENGGAKSPMR